MQKQRKDGSRPLILGFVCAALVIGAVWLVSGLFKKQPMSYEVRPLRPECYYRVVLPLMLRLEFTLAAFVMDTPVVFDKIPLWLDLCSQ